MVQREIHAYNKDGVYQGLHVATDEQFKENNPELVEGVKPLLPEPSIDPQDYPLTSYQFSLFNLDNGYDEAIDTVLAYLKATDLKRHNRLKGVLEHSLTFNFDVMFSFIGAADVAPLIPKHIDVSRETLTTLWMEVVNNG